MIVTIWRHGQAASGPIDRMRELTGDGEDDVGFGCHQFHDICHARGLAHPDLVLHSPWVRASQTADIIATAFTHANMKPLPALQPGSTPRTVDAALAELQAAAEPAGHVLLVSHQPLVSRLVDHYLGDPGQVPGLSPGALACLELEVAARGCGQLLFWAFPPEYAEQT